MKLLNTIKDIICESPKFNGTVTHDHRNRRVDMSNEAMKWKDKSPTYRQAATMEDIELEEVVEDMEVYHPDFLPEDMSIEDLENGSFNKGKYYTIQSPQKWVQHELGEDLENWSYDGDTIGIEKDLDEYVNKELYKTLKLNKGGEFNEEEDLEEYRFDFYEEDKKDCPKGMYYCSEDNICKPDSQRLKEQEDILNREGGYNNPIDKSTDGDVPGNSYFSRDYDSGTGKYYSTTVPTGIFYKAVDLLVNSKNKNWFVEQSNIDESPWWRQQEVWEVVKVLGFKKDSETILDKIFWAAYDNFDNMVNDTVTSYDELYLRPFIKVKVPMEQTVSVYKSIQWSPRVHSYDTNDATMSVLNDEDGIYEPYEWDSAEYDYSEEEIDWEGREKDFLGNETFEIVYPAQTGNRTPSGLTSGDGENDD